MCRRDSAITGEAFLQSLSAGNTADILGIEQPELLDAMIQKGYCADLSGSKVIASLVERMDPGPVSYTHLDVYKRQMWN